jgi:hypothetical protein
MVRLRKPTPLPVFKKELQLLNEGSRAIESWDCDFVHVPMTSSRGQAQAWPLLLTITSIKQQQFQMVTKHGQINRTKILRKADYQADKSFPDGIAQTVLAIQLMWHHLNEGGQAGLTHDQFYELTDFKDFYADVLHRYKGVTKFPTKPDTIASMVNDMANCRHDLGYYRLRTLADFIGLPTGLFLLFTQFVSRETQATEEEADPKARAQELLDDLKAVVSVIERQVMAAEEGQPVFRMLPPDGDERPLVNTRHLKEWVDAITDRLVQTGRPTPKEQIRHRELPDPKHRRAERKLGK